MSLATVYGTAQFGLADDATATGLFVGSVSFDGTSETVMAPDHIGCDVGLAVYNPKKDISVDGIIKTKGTGLVDHIGSVITLANTTNNTRTRLNEGLGDSIASATGASIIITGNSIKPTATGFEEGSMSGVYLPFVAASTVVTLT
jgi:nitrogen fixation protein